MRVALITPWDNAWVPYFAQAFSARGHEFHHVLKHSGLPDVDVILHGWASGASQPVQGKRNVLFLRRYELFDGGLQRVNWKHADLLITVNSWICSVVRQAFRDMGVSVPVELVYNGTDPGRWRYRERGPNHRIGMACHIHPKKNLPLALQVLALCPQDHELHIAGEVQDVCTEVYLNHVGRALRRRVYLYGHIPRSDLDLWWEQMGFCLSTSLSEGNPNNVIEAMAKGIKPVVHNWPGASDQFPETFNTAAEAVLQMSGQYDSAEYRRIVEERFGLGNIEKVVDLVEGLA